MTAQVLAFLRRPAAPRDWSTQEIAEFYRVESALIQAGLRVTSERGLTDEGEPWFVFCREEDDEVIIHFARIDGRYLISAPAYCGTATGPDFRALMRGVVERHPVLQPQASRKNLFLHPSALLVLLVASALLKAGHAAEAAPVKPAADEHDGKVRHGPAALVVDETMPAETQHETLILAAVNAAFAMPLAAEPATIVVSAASHLQEAVVDQPPHEQPAYPMLLDWLHGTEVAAGVADTTLTAPVLSSSVTPPLPEALPFAPVTIPIHQPDTISAVIPLGSVPVVPNFQLPDAFQSIISPDVALAPEITDYTHEFALASISSIPKTDLDLLHSLNVPDVVAYSPALPTALQSIVRAGTHTPVAHSDTSAAQSDSNAESTAQVRAADASSSNQTPTAAATLGTDPAATLSPLQQVASPSVSTIELPSSSLSSVLTTVEQFQAVAAHPVVLITAHAAIFYDEDAINNHYNQVQSVTYDFGDGFSISVVGLPSELSHSGIHA